MPWDDLPWAEASFPRASFCKCPGGARSSAAEGRRSPGHAAPIPSQQQAEIWRLEGKKNPWQDQRIEVAVLGT